MKYIEWIVVGLLFGAVAGIVSALLTPWAEKQFSGNYSEIVGGYLAEGEFHDYVLEVKDSSLVTLKLNQTPSDSTYAVQILKLSKNLDKAIGINNQYYCTPSPVVIECSAGYGEKDVVLSKHIANSGSYIFRITGRSLGTYYTVGLNVSRAQPPAKAFSFPSTANGA